MTETPTHLMAAIADLEVRKMQIDDAITAMRAVLANIYNVPNPSVPDTNMPSSQAIGTTGSDELVEIKPGTHPSTPPNTDGGSRTQRIRTVFEQHPGTYLNADKLVDLLGETPDPAMLNSISAILSRMRKSGAIEKGERRGWYRASQDTDPDNPFGRQASDAADPPEPAPAPADVEDSGLVPGFSNTEMAGQEAAM